MTLTSFVIDNILPPFIYFIIFVKIIFIIMAVSNIYLVKVSKDKQIINKYSKTTIFWKERTEYIFTICMAALLLFFFTPWYNNRVYLTKEICLLFYLFGWILLFTAHWDTFISEAPWYKNVIGAWN